MAGADPGRVAANLISCHFGSTPGCATLGELRRQ
jgi:hypothetical protein